MTGSPETREPRMVDIIIPAYNAADSIAEAIESVRSQTHQLWKLYVVDDGSTDSTRAVLLGFQEKLGARMNVISGNNSGACHARNEAIKKSSSSLLAFLDADDVWHPEKLSQQLKNVERNPDLVGVTTGFSIFDPSSSKRSENLVFRWSRNELISWTLLGSVAPALNSTLLIRREPLLAAGGYDENLGSHADDLDLAWRLLQQGPLEGISAPLAELRVSAAQAHRNQDSMLYSLAETYRKIGVIDPKIALKGRKTLALKAAVGLLASEGGLTNFRKLFATVLKYPIAAIFYFSRKVRAHLRFELK